MQILKSVLAFTVLLALVLVTPSKALAPELPNVPAESIKLETRQISRGGPSPKIEHRIMRITAYTKNDPGMDGRGITTSEEPVQEGITIAAPPEIPFGTQIYIPSLNRTYTVTDHGGAIKGNRLDLYMEKRSDALEFGVQELEVWIREER
jgi:rare lipoprotein A